MAENPVAIVVPSYGGVEGQGVKRLRFFLESVEKHDPKALDVPWLVVEDPCGNDDVSRAYEALCDRFSIPYLKLSQWSNMHGAAKRGFEAIHEFYDPEWTIYLGDDLACTPGALSNMIHFVTKNPLKTVSLVGFPYWNAHDFCKSGEGEWSDYLIEKGYKMPFWKKEEFYDSTGWIERVPRNPHWEGDGFARSYVNVNGVGFAARSSHYRSVGGFAERTWCLDESLSVRTWLHSDQSIVCLPGPPLVHYFGGSTPQHHMKTDAHTEQVWIAEMGLTKKEAGELSYAAMFEREPAVNEEMRGASYYAI